MQSSAMTQKLAAEGSQAGERMTPEQFKAFWLKEYEQVERQVKELKVKLY
jgi:tripartite-type tricarboxylate transporter receptor subunit TctC